MQAGGWERDQKSGLVSITTITIAPRALQVNCLVFTNIGPFLKTVVRVSQTVRCNAGIFGHWFLSQRYILEAIRHF